MVVVVLIEQISDEIRKGSLVDTRVLLKIYTRPPGRTKLDWPAWFSEVAESTSTGKIKGFGDQMD